MKTHAEIADRLSDLFSKVSHGRTTQREVDQELSEILALVNDEYRQEKIRNAIEWSGIYFSPRRWEKWGSPDAVKSFLLSDIYKARTASRTSA